MWLWRSVKAAPEPAFPDLPPAVPEPVAPDRNDGLTAITYFSGWITNADTKSALLAAGTTVLVATSFGESRRFLRSFPYDHWSDLPAGLFLLMAVVQLGIGVFHLVSALHPRLRQPEIVSRYAFPSVAVQPTGFLPELDADQQRAEAWAQARALAAIAITKFGHFRRALHAVVGGAVLLGIGTLLAG